MKDALRDLLVSYVGNDMAKIVVGPKGSGIENFLFEELKAALIDAYPTAEAIDTRGLSQDEIKKACLQKQKEEGRAFVFVKNLWDYSDFDVIINLCARHKGIDLFATASASLPVHPLDKHTLIRGRFETFHFPSTLYGDYLKEHPGSSVFTFLTHNDLDSDVVKENLKSLNESEIVCLRATLRYETKPLSERSLAKEVSKKTKTKFSWYRANAFLKKIEGLGICYALDRYDIKRKQSVSGQVFLPIDNRYYKIVGGERKRKELYMAPALVGRLLYDRWDVKKAIYESQRNNKEYCRNTDAGFLVKKNGWSFLLFLGESPTDELVEKAKLVPSALPKIIVAFDPFGGVDCDEDGIIYYSFETLLKEGLRIYGGRTGI